MSLFRFLFLLTLGPGFISLAPASSSTARISGGRFTPLFGLEPNQKDVPVRAFSMDRMPVTNAQFFSFTQRKSEWQKSKIAPLYTDGGYLKHWVKSEKGSLRPPKNLMNAPVTQVSWFAASAYCESVEGRLPSVLEWEYVAAADEKRPDASKDKAFAERILAWYAKPHDPSRLPAVGQSKANYWGVHDLHGLVWEWTGDFNSVFVNGDNRQDGDKSQEFTCGNGATGSRNREDYAAFMRYAMRSSLSANFTTSNLGFRCVYDGR